MGWNTAGEEEDEGVWAGDVVVPKLRGRQSSPESCCVAAEGCQVLAVEDLAECRWMLMERVALLVHGL